MQQNTSSSHTSSPRRYGEADGGGSCAGDFGNALVKRWRDTKKTYCAPTVPESEGGGGVRSEIDCYLVHQTRHHGNGDNLCVPLAWPLALLVPFIVPHHPSLVTTSGA